MTGALSECRCSRCCCWSLPSVRGVLAVRPTLLPRRLWTALSALSAVAAVLLFRVAVFNVGNPIAGPPDEKNSARILMHVLTNVSHAFIERDEASLRKALGDVVAQDRLGDVERELRRAIAIKIAGGGVARVNTIKNVTVKDVTALNGVSGFRSVAEWTAKASAGHWGHAHRRTIRFRALVEVVQRDGVWKLVGITVTNAKQQG